jgi:hypothetical protein
MTDISRLKDYLVVGVYFAVLLLLLRPAGNGPSMITQTGVALAAVAGA